MRRTPRGDRHRRRCVRPFVALAVTGAAVVAAACGGAHDAALGPGGIGAARADSVVPAPESVDGATTGTAGISSDASIDDPGTGGLVHSTDDGATARGVGADTTATAPAALDTSAPTTTEARPDASALLAFTGDVLAHSPLWRGAAANAGGDGYDFRPMFASIAPVIGRADLAVCHLETPIAPEGEELSTDPVYGVPPEIVEAIASGGHDRCSTASNHVLDRGVAGIDRTVEVLLANGIGQSGMARTEEEARPSVFSVNGITMAHLSATYATNGIPIPSAEPWRTRLIDVDAIVADATVARELGSELTIVSLHWGTEKEHRPNDEQRAVAERLTASGVVDLVIGHHAHVVQPIEQSNGVWVAYGLGNILSNLPAADHWPAASQDGVVVEFPVERRDGIVTVGEPLVIPTWVDKENGWIVRDVLAELGDASTPDWRRRALQSSRDRTAAILGSWIPT